MSLRPAYGSPRGRSRVANTTSTISATMASPTTTPITHTHDIEIDVTGSNRTVHQNYRKIFSPFLYDSIGQAAGCKALAAEFYSRVKCDSLLRPLFPGKSLACAIEEFAAFLVQLLGGPSADSQRRWWVSLRESHARFPITPRHRDQWLRLMRQTLDARAINPAARAELRGFFERSASYAVNLSAEGPVELAPVEEAVAAVRRGKIPRSLHPGILALLVRHGNDAQRDYVLRELDARPELIHERFAGRTLLQDAAAAGSLSMVERLLHLGGAHEHALYRVANECSSSEGALIVRALVRAGADINAVYGVKRCTPLHMAARRGNVAIAKALLELGAVPDPPDSQGVTPFQRALNCRKPAVAAAIMEYSGRQAAIK